MADLETPDTPPEVATTPPPAEPDPTDTPAPEPAEAEPEGTIETAGGKHVPLATLLELRREKDALKQKAAQYDQLAGYVNQVRPYIDFLAANPNLMTRQDAPPPTPASQVQPVDPKAEALAKTLDLYTADGKPDVARAQIIREMVKAEAEEQAEAKVKPLQEQNVNERAAHMYQRALVTKAPNGTGVPKETLDAIWSRTDPRILATEEGAAGVVAMALGLSFLQGQAPAVVTPPAQPPLHTEPAGGRNPTRVSLSALDEKIAQQRGIDHKTYAERLKGFAPGRPNQLED